MTPENENLNPTPQTGAENVPPAETPTLQDMRAKVEALKEPAAGGAHEGTVAQLAEGLEILEQILNPAENLAALQTQLATLQDSMLRTAAEYENFRKRSAKEKDGAFSNGLGFAATALLPVLDTLEMAAAAPTEDENFKKGVLLTLEKCRQVFESLGIKEFDPNLHAAVVSSEDGEPGTVTAVLQKGYLLGDKVLRHASVAVAGA